MPVAPLSLSLWVRECECESQRLHGVCASVTLEVGAPHLLRPHSMMLLMMILTWWGLTV